MLKYIKFITSCRYIQNQVYKRSPAYREFERKRKRDIYYKEDSFTDRELNRKAVDNALFLLYIMSLVDNYIISNIVPLGSFSKKYDHHLFYNNYLYTLSQVTTNNVLTIPVYFYVFTRYRLFLSILCKYFSLPIL